MCFERGKWDGVEGVVREENVNCWMVCEGGKRGHFCWRLCVEERGLLIICMLRCFDVLVFYVGC